jgi:CheY-like chemotaxis protein
MKSAESHCRVLVVDDNQDAANSLVLLLKLWGYEACAAYDGPSAIALAQSFLPEVVLLDLGLPGGMSGFDVAKELRQRPETCVSFRQACMNDLA